jgi:cyclic-di-GMP phosphodiesterase TipF (flagellum assembly factor)
MKARGLSRQLTLVFLFGTYLVLSVLLAMGLWVNGDGYGSGLAAGIALFGLCIAMHGQITRFIEMAQVREAIDGVRGESQSLVAHVEAGEARIAANDLRIEAITRSLEDERRQFSEVVQALSARAAAARTPALPRPEAHELRETVAEALAGGRVDLHLQPVVGLPQRKLANYEGFSRLRDASGNLIMPAEFLGPAEAAGLIPEIDMRLVRRCLQVARRLDRQGLRAGFFCNLSMVSLADAGFVADLVHVVETNRDIGDPLIVELGQDALRGCREVHARGLAHLAAAGVRFSLDKVTDLDLDLPGLRQAQIQFVKIGAQRLVEDLMEVDGLLTLKSFPDIAAEDLVALGRRYGVELIAEKVEHERQVVDLLDLGLSLGQGRLFGAPRAVRGAVFEGAGVDQAAA